MKVGIKAYSGDPKSYLLKRDFADYIEVLVEPGKPIGKFLDFDYEYVIHAAHVAYSVNLASKERQQFSLQATLEAIKAADELNAKTIIVHPGYRQTPKDTAAESSRIFRESLSELSDSRIVLENCSYLDDWNKGTDHYLAYDYPSLKRFSGLFDSRICLDFSHAIASAKHLGKDWRGLVNSLLKLDVRLFHLCDGIIASGMDKHLNLFEGDFDLSYLKSLVQKSVCKRVTLETTMSLKSQRKDFEFLKS
jgi:endonuclease IV